MLLDINERVELIKLLPSEGTYAALKSLRVAREIFSPTAEEITATEMVSGYGADGKPFTNWNPQRASQIIKDIPVEKYIAGVIRDKLAALNKQQKLTQAQFSIYEKFVVDYT